MAAITTVNNIKPGGSFLWMFCGIFRDNLFDSWRGAWRAFRFCHN